MGMMCFYVYFLGLQNLARFWANCLVAKIFTDIRDTLRAMKVFTSHRVGS